MEAKNNIGANKIIGLLVILAGSLFLLRNFGYFPGEYLHYIFKWQTILIVLGIIFYFNSHNKTVGSILLVVGILGLVPNIWPVFLIAIGAYIIFRNKSNTANNIDMDSNEPDKTINDVSIFGGAKKNIQIENFKGGNLTAIFGGSELNFTDSTLADGVHKLEVLFIFGGTSLMIPSDWSVSLETVSIFGSMKDKRVIQQSQVFNKDKQLIITGLALFGGGDLKNFVSF